MPGSFEFFQALQIGRRDAGPGTVFASAMPFVVISLLMLVAVFFFRPIATWLPALLG
ncbi:hypothetical protein [Delftia sp. Cs1-4]|uniref:hypothetical protein n=1 Tax=Delftia sp. (strain Cs1-4) TaxID=742013 RepID=UPI0003152C0D|nr:hypothetical protein [Delftia sp. Cs1-4]